jgi:hypothetical protein
MSPLAVQIRLLARQIALLLFMLGLVLLILHVAAGRYVVAALYDGVLTPVFGDILEGRTAYTVDHYHRVLNQRVAHYLTLLAVFALAAMCLSLPAQRMILAVLALDILFMVVDRSFDMAGVRHSRFAITRDGGYPELFQYIKQAGIAAGFAALYTRRRRHMYLVWSALFIYVVLDDAFQAHEKFGLLLSTHLRLPAVMGLPPEGLGELLVMGAVGVLFIALIITTYVQATLSEKRTTRWLLALLGFIALFGVGFDAVTMVFYSGWASFLEDAGEMLAVTALVWYVRYRLIGDSESGVHVAP